MDRKHRGIPCRYLTEVAGDKPISGYVRADAAKLRDSPVESGLAGSSVSRLFTTVKSIFNFACMETGLEVKNPFAGLYLDREQGVSVRKPIPAPVIKRVQAECVRFDDPLRWAAALLSDTGMRIEGNIGIYDGGESSGLIFGEYNRAVARYE